MTANISPSAAAYQPPKPTALDHPLMPTVRSVATPAARPAAESRSNTSAVKVTMPKYWHNDYPSVWAPLRPTLRITFRTLCLFALGQTTLEHRWRVLTARSGDEYKDDVARITSMLTALNVISGFLLTGTAALITTEPPRTDILDYTRRVPAICFILSFSIALCGIIYACAALAILSAATRKWQLEVTMATRGRIWMTLLLLSLPFIAISISLGMAGLGLLVAAWSSKDTAMHVVTGIIMGVGTVLTVVFFAAIAGTRRKGLAAKYQQLSAGEGA
ncbi:unnamed protein product [Peniophora sp. CBMAI 1063]|nr:unnamed protein product [Peniophora sp. CBMAI 1063]